MSRASVRRLRARGLAVGQTGASGRLVAAVRRETAVCATVLVG